VRYLHSAKVLEENQGASIFVLPASVFVAEGRRQLSRLLFSHL